MKPVYFDNNATTRVDPRVVEAMLPFFTEQFGNPSSMHAFGANVSAAVNCARGELQNLLSAEHDHEIVFTSGGTESDNAAILSALEANPRRCEIVTSAVEHPAVLSLCAWLEKNKGVRVHVIPVDEKGRLEAGRCRLRVINSFRACVCYFRFGPISRHSLALQYLSQRGQ